MIRCTRAVSFRLHPPASVGKRALSYRSHMATARQSTVASPTFLQRKLTVVKPAPGLISRNTAPLATPTSPFDSPLQTTTYKNMFFFVASFVVSSSREKFVKEHRCFFLGGGAQFVHGRSRMTIDPCIPTMPGRSTSDFHQPGRHCLHHA